MPRIRFRSASEDSRLRYVQNFEDIRENVIRFNEAIVRQDPRFLKPVSHYKKWYYLDDLDLFAPEKFIGHINMNVDNYFARQPGSNESCARYLSCWFESTNATELADKLRIQIGRHYRLNSDFTIYRAKQEYVQRFPFVLAEEISQPQDIHEGALKRILVNRYERNEEARTRCIEHYGLECQVCRMNFEERYGVLGRRFIHIHHFIPLHTIGEDYVVDPVEHLRPVCPNCHAMLHIGNEVLTISELQEMMAVCRKNETGWAQNEC